MLVAFLGLLLFSCTACRSTISQKQKDMTDSAYIADLLKTIDSGDLARWSGLRSGLEVEDFKAAGVEIHVQAGHTLGRERYATVQVRGEQPQPLTLFVDGEGKVVLMRLPDALLEQSAEELEEMWGASELRQNVQRDSPFAPSEQWIWAGRGITLYVMNPQQKGGMALSSISLYPPTTAETYLEELGGNETVRFFPQR